MNLMIVSTLPVNDPQAQKAVRLLTSKVDCSRVFYTEEMKISPCLGCNACWLKTPGKCALHDDYEQILKGCLQYDAVVLLSGTSFGFIHSAMKNVIDRLLPLATMYICVQDGQIRHIPRYQKDYRFLLLYSGKGDEEYLKYWMERFTLNFYGKSLGVFPLEKCEEALQCI